MLNFYFKLPHFFTYKIFFKQATSLKLYNYHVDFFFLNTIEK